MTVYTKQMYYRGTCIFYLSFVRFFLHEEKLSCGLLLIFMVILSSELYLLCLPVSELSFLCLIVLCVFALHQSISLTTPEFLETLLKRTDVPADSYSYCICVARSL